MLCGAIAQRKTVPCPRSTSPPCRNAKAPAIRRHSTRPAPSACGSGLGNAGGLTDFGVNLMHLPPGNWSSQRHWHSHEDEFVYVLEGELTLIEDGGETVLRAGDCAAFPKGSGNGHHMINRSGAMAVYLEVGSRAARRHHHLLRHRHDELQRRRPVRAQGWLALSGAVDHLHRARAKHGSQLWGEAGPYDSDENSNPVVRGRCRHRGLHVQRTCAVRGLLAQAIQGRRTRSHDQQRRGHRSSALLRMDRWPTRQVRCAPLPHTNDAPPCGQSVVSQEP